MKMAESEKSELSVLICEDKALNLRLNEAYVKELSKKHQINVDIYCCNISVENPLEMIKNHEIHILLMDICPKEKKGIEIVKEFMNIYPEIAVIYITRFTEFSMDAFKAKAFGYVQKPIVMEDLEEYYIRAVDYIRGLREKKNRAVLHFICNREKISLVQKNIIYMEKVQRKVNIVTPWKTFSPYISIAELEKVLISDFIKINQGTLINRREVLFWDTKTVTMSTGDCLSIGRGYRKKRKTENEK